MQLASLHVESHANPNKRRSSQVMDSASSAREIRPPPRSLVRTVSVESPEMSDTNKSGGTCRPSRLSHSAPGSL